MLVTFNIQRYSIHDGEGIRTNIFFKGCPLRCSWCNNPESQEFSPSLMYDSRLCKGFGDCSGINEEEIKMINGKPEIKREIIKNTGRYIDVCPSKALAVSGELKSADQIINEIEKDFLFFANDKGGVTLTGGEPFSQKQIELKKLLKELKERGIHVAIETSLHVEWKIINEYTNLIDMFLADLKHINPLKFEQFTGGNADLVLDNFRKLDDSGVHFIARIPVVPLFNFSDQELRSIIDFATGLKNIIELHFIPFHNLGAEKYTMLGIKYDFRDQKKLGKEALIPWVNYSKGKGVEAKIVE